MRILFEVMVARLLLQAFIEVIAYNDHHQTVRTEDPLRKFRFGQILGKTRAGESEAVDTALRPHQSRQATLQRGVIRHHQGFHIAIADDSEQRRMQGGVVVLIVDEAIVVDPATIHNSEIPSDGHGIPSIGRVSRHRVARVHRHLSESARHGKKAQHDLGDDQEPQDADRHRERGEECAALPAA